MKIRSGFVSNSSSSSYVILTTKEIYKDFVKNIKNKNVRKIFVSEFTGFGEKAMIGGKEYLDLSRVVYSDDFGHGDVTIKEDDYYEVIEKAISLVDDFVDYVNKHGGYARSSGY